MNNKFLKSSFVGGLLGLSVLSGAASAGEVGPFNSPRVSGTTNLGYYVNDAFLFSGDTVMLTEYCKELGYTRYSRQVMRMLISMQDYQRGYGVYYTPVNVAWSGSSSSGYNITNTIGPFPVVEQLWCND